MLTKANEWRAAREAARRQSMATARMLRGIRGTRWIETYEENIGCGQQPQTHNSSRRIVLKMDETGQRAQLPEGAGGRSSRDGPPG